MPKSVLKRKPSAPLGRAGTVSGIHPPPGPYVPACGPTPSPVLLVGERPGEQEYKQSKPFVGPSGEILDMWLDAADLDRDCCRVTNVCQDYLPGNPEPHVWELERDRPREASWPTRPTIWCATTEKC